jgi:hypothetical protein
MQTIRTNKFFGGEIMRCKICGFKSNTSVCINKEYWWHSEIERLKKLVDGYVSNKSHLLKEIERLKKRIVDALKWIKKNRYIFEIEASLDGLEEVLEGKS